MEAGGTVLVIKGSPQFIVVYHCTVLNMKFSIRYIYIFFFFIVRNHIAIIILTLWLIIEWFI